MEYRDFEIQVNKRKFEIDGKSVSGFGFRAIHKDDKGGVSMSPHPKFRSKKAVLTVCKQQIDRYITDREAEGTW